MDKNENYIIHLSDWDLEDLQLSKLFLLNLEEKAESLDKTCNTRHKSTKLSDSLKGFICGFTTQGIAWKYFIPEHLKIRAYINLL